MRLLSSILLAGAAVAGLAVVAPTVARELDTHRLTVQLPGGGVETIEYSGKLAPRVTFQPVMVPAAHAAFDPWADSFWPAGFAMPSFATFDRLAADMDARMDAMLRQADMLSRLPQGQALDQAVIGDLPQGATSFSIVSSSNGVCTHVTRITRSAGDAKPQVVSQTSGDCGTPSHAAAPTDVKQINYQAPAPKPGRTAL